MAGIFLFTGENAYALQEEKRRWIGQFERKHGADNLIRLSGKEVTVRTLLDEISVMPFLAESRLVIVDGVPRADKEEIAALEVNIHPQTVLLFVDEKPDKRLGGTKALLDLAEVKEFKPLQAKPLQDWAMAFVQEKGASLSPTAWKSLVELTGDDQYQLAQELTKLALHAAGRAITAEDVDELAIPSDEGIVWKMTDLLCAGDKAAAVRYARRMLSRGGDMYGLWAVLLSTVRNLVAVSAAMSAGLTDSKEIAAETGVHPFALRSLLSYARRAKGESLRTFCETVASDDVALKTGAVRATDEAPEELLSMIDRLILTSP
jgi:DNA polymerase III subunit delta